MSNGNHPPTKRIACDECPVIVDNVTYFPHEGQWVDVIPVGSMREQLVLGDFSRLSVEAAAAEDDPQLQRELNLRLSQVNNAVLQVLADRVIDWNWTDAYGRALPKPDGTAQGIDRITQSEMWWLLTTIRTGGASATVGKGESGTPTTSSDSSPPPDQTTSSTDPSPKADG